MTIDLEVYYKLGKGDLLVIAGLYNLGAVEGYPVDDTGFISSRLVAVKAIQEFTAEKNVTRLQKRIDKLIQKGWLYRCLIYKTEWFGLSNDASDFLFDLSQRQLALYSVNAQRVF